MKKLEVIKDKCIGCGMCISNDSNHFDFDSEDGLSTVISQDNLDTPELKEAISSCPTQAISLNDCECENCNCNNDGSCGCGH